MIKVFLSGTFDPLHSGHVALFEKASALGDLYVGIGNDNSVSRHKHKVFWPAEERLYVVKAIRYVKDASINTGDGFFDYITNPMFLDADALIVDRERESDDMRAYCEGTGKIYMVIDRVHAENLPERSSTEIREYEKNNN